MEALAAAAAPGLRVAKCPEGAVARPVGSKGAEKTFS